MNDLAPEVQLQCADCGSSMKRMPTQFGFMYGCSTFPICKGSHSCHPDGRPLGVPANQALKAARIAVHASLDPIWQNAHSVYQVKSEQEKKRLTKMARGRVYWYLAEHMGLTSDEAHVGLFDEEMCDRALVILHKVTYEKVRKWAQQEKLVQSKQEAVA